MPSALETVMAELAAMRKELSEIRDVIQVIREGLLDEFGNDLFEEVEPKKK